jgi:hypothetical protein
MKVKELFEEEVISIASRINDTTKNRRFLNNPKSLDCSFLHLNSLDGSPERIANDFDCSNNDLKSLKGGPKSVGGDFVCYANPLVSLDFAPHFIGGTINFATCEVFSFGNLNCEVRSHVFGSNNKFTSLHNIHKHFTFIGGMARFKETPITSCVLGLLLIKGLRTVYLDNKEVQVILNKHLRGDRDIFACQEELIEAGFEDYAQL